MDLSQRVKLFQRELFYIFDANIKEFAKMLLENADEYFFTVPASSSGKYHPDFARGNGGLVRHTKAVAYFTNELCRVSLEAKKLNRHEADLLIVAAIAHDIKKQGDGKEGHTVREHPTLAVEYVLQMWKEHGKELIDKDSVNYICDAIESHMGPWQQPVPETRPQLIVFYADYIASRKEIIGLDFIDNNDTSFENNEPYKAPEPEKYTVETYKFTFGKTNGKTIPEAYKENPGYIRWIANKEDFSFEDVRSLVLEFLNNKEKYLI